MSNAPYILALDISSTHIGVVLYHDAVADGTPSGVVEHTEWTLQGDIAERCRRAYNHFFTLLERFPAIDCLAIEAPVIRFGGSIPQIRVSGAILTLAGQRDIPYLDVSPAAAKRALTGKGNADKETMQARAHAYGITGEHAADALGVALSAAGKVEVVV